jgi:hypothetical protein
VITTKGIFIYLKYARAIVSNSVHVGISKAARNTVSVRTSAGFWRKVHRE